MRLDETRSPATVRDEEPTIDDMFKAATAMHPEAIALVDPPGRMAHGQPARRLTYREADRVVSALAGRLRTLNLPADSLIAFQLPNTVEFVLTMLAILRAGHIAAPLPFLWRKADAAAALARVAPRVLIATAPAEDAMYVAAETFSIRFVCAFGQDLPDGLIPLEDVFTQAPEHVPPLPRPPSPEDHVAIVTFDVIPEGIVPVARSHRQFLDAAQSIAAVVGYGHSVRMLTTLALSSYGALAISVGGWLVSGGTLVLHHTFSALDLAAQSEHEACNILIVPGPLAASIAAAGIAGQGSRLAGLWRAPERLFLTNGSAAPEGVIEFAAFGEIACVPVTRQQDGRVSPFAKVDMKQPPRPGAVEISVTDAGTLAVRGRSVPVHAFPPKVGDRLPKLKIDEFDWVDTEYPCRVDPNTKGLLMDGPPPGIITVGGCRFRLRDLQDLADRLDNGARIAALPDAISGQRLAGVGTSRPNLRETLLALGIHPLIVEAFRDRRSDPRATAA